MKEVKEVKTWRSGRNKLSMLTTIPKTITRMLELEPGDVLKVGIDGDKIVYRKKEAE